MHNKNLLFLLFQEKENLSSFGNCNLYARRIGVQGYSAMLKMLLQLAYGVLRSKTIFYNVNVMPCYPSKPVCIFFRKVVFLMKDIGIQSIFWVSSLNHWYRWICEWFCFLFFLCEGVAIVFLLQRSIGGPLLYKLHNRVIVALRQVLLEISNSLSHCRSCVFSQEFCHLCTLCVCVCVTWRPISIFDITQLFKRNVQVLCVSIHA